MPQHHQHNQILRDPKLQQFVLIVIIFSLVLIYSCYVIVNEVKNQKILLRQQLNEIGLALNLSVQRYEFMPYSLSRDEKIINLLREKDAKKQTKEMNRYLKSIQVRTGALSIYIIDLGGNIISSSDFGQCDSAIGCNVSHRPYFINADTDNTIGYFGVGVSNGIPGYFLVNSISWNGEKIGAISVKVNLDDLINTRGGEGEIILLDQHDIIASSSNPNWFYHSISPLPKLQYQKISEEQRYRVNDIPMLDYRNIIKENDDSWIVSVAKKYYMASESYVSDINMTLVRLLPMSAIFKAIWPKIGGIIATFAFCAILFKIIVQRNKILSLKIEKQQALKKKNRSLENLVMLRTYELAKKTINLEAEIKERVNSENILRNMQKELLHNEKLAAIGQLSAGLAHEINQPLAAISMISANTMRFIEIGEWEEARSNLARIARLVDFIGQLSNQLRTFSRVGDDSISSVSLKISIDNAMLLLSHKFKTNNFTFTRIPPSSEIYCLCNNLRLEQVLVNLISNGLDAISHENSAGNITAKWYKDGDSAVIEIEDNGPGIPLNVIEHIFEPFFTTKTSHGLGLGLAISADIIKSFKGSLSAINIETGARFIIRLPLYKES
ncbi:sensor histidine kinase [Hafnia alvei]|uniref:sensor histidine kinase n=1 Tax=Hafnia alvei TaxID=569 RepID=UPI000699FA97|nr:ATP-binding protein [Hafnia alvei]